MHARVTQGKVAPDKAAAATSTYRDSVVPAAKKQTGFRGAFLLEDPTKNGKFISMTLWESEATMNESESGGYYQEQIGKVAVYFTEQPKVEHYEVSVQELA